MKPVPTPENRTAENIKRLRNIKEQFSNRQMRALHFVSKKPKAIHHRYRKKNVEQVNPMQIKTDINSRGETYKNIPTVLEKDMPLTNKNKEKEEKEDLNLNETLQTQKQDLYKEEFNNTEPENPNVANSNKERKKFGGQ